MMEINIKETTIWGFSLQEHVCYSRCCCFRGIPSGATDCYRIYSSLMLYLEQGLDSRTSMGEDMGSILESYMLSILCHG